MATAKNPHREPILEVKELCVTYGSKQAVDNVTFSIKRGEIFGLLGPNGAGKTSTLSAIEGLVRPHSGTLLLDGADMREHPTQVKANMGVQLQSTSFQFELTINQLVKLYAGLYNVTLTNRDIMDSLRTIGIEN